MALYWDQKWNLCIYHIGFYPECAQTWDFDKSSLQRQVNKTVIWQDQLWDLRSVTRGKENTCNVQRKVSSNSSQEPCLERESVYNRTAAWWLQTPFLSHHSSEPVPGGRVPHKLSSKTKLGICFSGQLLIHRQKSCAQNMAQSLSDQKLEICLCSLNSSFSEPPRDLWVCSKTKAGSWKQTQTHRSAIPQGKAPLLISVSLKATQENSETLAQSAQSPDPSTTTAVTQEWGYLHKATFQAVAWCVFECAHDG